MKESQPLEGQSSSSGAWEKPLPTRLLQALPSSASLAALGHLALETSNNFLPIVFPLLIPSMGLTYTQVGVLIFIWNVAGTLTQPLFGYLSDRWNPQMMVVLSVAWLGALMGLVGFARAFWQLIPLVGLGALGAGAFHPPGAAIAASSGHKRQGAAMSIFSVSGNFGVALSPMLVGTAIAWWDIRGTAVVIPLALFASLLLLWGFRSLPMVSAPSSTASNSEGKGMQSTGSVLALVLVVFFVATRSWIQMPLASYIPEWLASGGRSLESAGLTLSVLLFSIGVGSLTGGTLSDRVGRVPVVLTSMSLLVLAQWLFFHLTGALQILSAGFIGLMIGASFPVAILMAQQALPQRVGLASSVVMGFGWLPAGIGSWAVGILADHTTLTNALQTLIYVPILGVGAVILYALHMRKRQFFRSRG